VCPINRQKPRATTLLGVNLENINPSQFSWLEQTTKNKRRKAVFLLCVPNDRFSSYSLCSNLAASSAGGTNGERGWVAEVAYTGPRPMHGPVDRYTDNKMSPITYQRITQIHTGHRIRLKPFTAAFTPKAIDGIFTNKPMVLMRKCACELRLHWPFISFKITAVGVQKQTYLSAINQVISRRWLVAKDTMKCN
jgi:hypothetical protein